MSKVDEHGDDRIEQAISARLSKLGTMPVDTSRVAAKLRQQISPRSAGHRVLRWTLRIAAILLVAVTILLAANLFSGPALASPARLAEIHSEVIAGHTGSMVQVTSIDGAAKAINEQWKHAPDLPHAPGKDVMACGVHEMGRKKMAVVCLTVDGTPVSMAVAEASDVKSPAGQTVTRNSVEYLVSSADGVNMAMTKRDDRWVCLMGRVPTDRLITIISDLQF